jgi:hypothetical protein
MKFQIYEVLVQPAFVELLSEQVCYQMRMSPYRQEFGAKELCQGILNS